MLFDIKFSFFPGASDCISWSADGDIAIINGEFIHVLSPIALPLMLGLSAGGPDPRAHTDKAEQWTLHRFRANAFATDEVPKFDPMGFKGFSIGEEQSPALVAGINWSPPGVARYGHCVLSVLNQNHVLSLWEGGAGVDGWKKCCVVNKGVMEYWRKVTGGEEVEDSSRSFLWRLRRRVRAWGWSGESLVQGTPKIRQKNSGFSGSSGEFFMALANDNREIQFARMRSPREFSNGKGTEEWRAEVIGHAQAQVADEGNVDRPVSLANRPARFINKVAWSPWYSQKPGRVQALLAYSLLGRLKLMGVSTTTKESPLFARLSAEELNFQIDFTDFFIGKAMTPSHRFQKLLWYEKIWHNSLILVVATPGSIRVVSVSMGSNQAMEEFTESMISVHEYPVTNWDSVSGMTIQADPRTPETLHVHVATVLSHNIILEYTVNYSDSVGPQTTLSVAEDNSSWVDSILSLSSDFDAIHGLSGHVSAKTWGISQSPLGGYMAACVTLHPSGMLEYNTRNMERCHIIFGNESEGLQKSLGLAENEEVDPAILNAKFVSVRAFVHEIRHLDDPAEIGIIRQGQGRRLPVETFKNLLKSLQYAIYRHSSDQSMQIDSIKFLDTNDPLTLVSTLRYHAIYNPILTAHRYHFLVSCLLLSSQRPPSPSSSGRKPPLSDGVPMEPLLHLTTSILAIPHRFTPLSSVLSARILYAFACVGALGLHEIPRILQLSEQAFEYLARIKKADLKLELDHCRRRQEVAAQGPFGGVGDMRTISFPPRRGKDIKGAEGKRGVWEICEICGGGIGWGDLRLAKCVNGHVFVRCALSFLAIQRPGISKFCGVCGKEYLTEDFVGGYEARKSPTPPSRGGQEGQDEPPDTRDLAEVLLDAAMEVDNTEEVEMADVMSSRGGRGVDAVAEDEAEEGEQRFDLAGLLFAACDVCVYCGGKFKKGSF